MSPTVVVSRKRKRYGFRQVYTTTSIKVLVTVEQNSPYDNDENKKDNCTQYPYLHGAKT